MLRALLAAEQYLTDGVDAALSASPIALPINALANLLALGTTFLDVILGGSVPDAVVHCCWLSGGVSALFVVRSTWRDLGPRSGGLRAR